MSSSGAEIAGKKVTLRSSDGEVYVVEEVEVLESKTIKDVLEDGSPDDVITLPNVTGEILSKIIEYCKKHVNAASALANYEVSVNDDDRKFLEKIIEYGNNNIISESLLKIIQDCEEHVKATSVKDDDRKFLWKIIEYDKKHRTGLLLWQIIKDWEKHVNFPSTIADDLKAFDANLVEVDRDTLYALILAANYLNIKSLLDLTCEVVADMIKGKTPLEIREFFGIKELTPEEEEEVRRENQWAFE